MTSISHVIGSKLYEMNYTWYKHISLSLHNNILILSKKGKHVSLSFYGLIKIPNQKLSWQQDCFCIMCCLIVTQMSLQYFWTNIKMWMWKHIRTHTHIHFLQRFNTHLIFQTSSRSGIPFFFRILMHVQIFCCLLPFIIWAILGS